MMQRIKVLLLAAVVTAAPLTAHAALLPLMDFEGFPAGLPLPSNAYPGFAWEHELVFSTFGTALAPPFPGPHVLVRDACPVGIACDLEVKTADSIKQFTISGFTAGGPDLFVLALDDSGNVVGDTLGNVNLVIDTDQQSVGCFVATPWSCDRAFSFAAGTGATTLRFITSGTAVIDNLQITTFDALPPPNGVPEPGSVALIAAALLSGFGFRRRVTARPA